MYRYSYVDDRFQEWKLRLYQLLVLDWAVHNYPYDERGQPL